MSGARETPLEARIKAQIRAAGPLSIADYMAQCLGDPDYGYYMTRQPFGQQGDFITAPEVSQMFGELIGAWLATVWDAMGRPDPVHLVELGPGRGTLMVDVLRTLGKVPALRGALRVHLVEMSPRLRAEQDRALAAIGAQAQWHERIGSLRREPTLWMANEFFDALPIRQYVKHGRSWVERVIALDAEDRLTLALGAGRLTQAELPAALAAEADGAVLETCPVGTAIMAEIADRIVAHGGAALVIDYGYAATGCGDTLQAVARHEPVDVLERPGEVDVTAHVNFEALARAARSSGAAVAGPTQQGAFLLALGLIERAGRLGSGRDEAVQERLRGEVERLAGPDEMGALFKVIAVTRAGLRVPGFG